MNVPTAHSTRSLRGFLQHIVDSESPTTVDRLYLKRAGFVSDNDPELIHIFQLLGFIDYGGTPTPRWDHHRSGDKGALRAAVVEFYAELFEVFPTRPWALPDNELALWFKPPRTGRAISSQERAIRTFRHLCQAAGLSRTVRKTMSRLSDARSGHEHTPPTIVVQLPRNQTREQYARMFDALHDSLLVQTVDLE